jgi:RNA polymerase sigma-70 factor (ECF subfamily)
MRSVWRALGESLARSIRTEKAQQHFNSLKQQYPIFSTFADAPALITYFNSEPWTSDERDDKDQLYAALVRLIQGGGSNGKLAGDITWLGLMPGLHAIFKWRLQFHGPDPERAACAALSEISDHFAQAVLRANTGRINRVAATLVMNTRRRVITASLRAKAENEREAALPADKVLADPAEDPRMRDSMPLAALGIDRVLADDNEQKALIRERLTAQLGADAELVMAVVIDGRSQREVAGDLGISHEAARKRFQRSIARLKKIASDLSQSAE